VLFAGLGTVAGLIYAALGVLALKHLPNATESDKTVGWSLWWFAERSRYTPAGQRLCNFGAVAAAVSVIAWLAWAWSR